MSKTGRWVWWLLRPTQLMAPPTGLIEVEPDSGEVRVLTSGPGIYNNPSWSPDGTWLVYDHEANQGSHPTSWRIGSDGAGQRPLASPDTVDVDARLPPDGRSGVFVRVSSDGGMDTSQPSRAPWSC